MIIKLTKCKSFAKAVISDTLLAAKTYLCFIFCIFLGSLSGVGSSLIGKKGGFKCHVSFGCMEKLSIRCPVRK